MNAKKPIPTPRPAASPQVTNIKAAAFDEIRQVEYHQKRLGELNQMLSQAEAAQNADQMPSPNVPSGAPSVAEE